MGSIFYANFMSIAALFRAGLIFVPASVASVIVYFFFFFFYDSFIFIWLRFDFEGGAQVRDRFLLRHGDRFRTGFAA